MKRIAISEKDRRTVTIGVVIAIVALGYFKGAKPYATAYADATTQLDSNRKAYAKEAAEVKASQRNPMLQHVADSAMDAMGKRLFVGKDSVAATDDLEQYIKLLAHEARVHVSQSRTEGVTTLSTGVRTLRLGFIAQSDLPGIIAFLDSLDHGDHLVCIEKMQLAILSSVDTSKGVQEIQMTATADGYQVPSGVNATVTAVRPGLGLASAAQLGGGLEGGLTAGAPGAAGGRGASTASLPCDPSPPTSGPSPAPKKIGQ